MAGTGKKIFKILIWIILIFLLLITGTGIFGYFKAEDYINKNLSQIVSNKSNQLYKLSFNNIDLEILPLSIIISDINLTPDEKISKEVLNNSPETIFYSFQSSEVEINNIDLKLLIKHKKLFCKKITISQPNIELSGEEILQNNSEQSMDKLFSEMRPLFQKYINEIVIEDIEFANANYVFYNTLGDSAKVSNAKQISVGIKNFRTDSTLISGKKHLFETDDVFVRMKDFEHNLSDSLHTLKIDTLEYSLKSADINATGFQLTHNFKNAEKSLYDVFVPKMHMISDDLTRFSINDSIKIQYLEFEKPRIKYYQKENPKQLKIEDLSNFNLYDLIENQFTKIEIDSFYFTKANLEIYRQPDFENYQQKFTSVDIKLKGFALDSVSSKNQNKLLNADNLEMNVTNYHLRLDDNEHNFRADSMFISTYSNSLGLKKISIVPSLTNGGTSRTQLNLDCNALEIDDINLKTLYHTRTLPTRRIIVSEPKVHLQYNAEIAKSNKQKETGLLFELVSAYLKGVYSDLVTVEKGTLNIQNLYNKEVQGYFETDFNFDLTGFSLDSTSIKRTDKFFYATNFDLEFSDYQMRLVDDLHKINVEQISILSFERKVDIRNLKLQPVIEKANNATMKEFNRSELYNISVPRITLWGINLRNAFFYNKLNISRFQIMNPKIYFENFGALRQTQNKKEFSEFSQLIFNYLTDINISKIDIPNGSLTWVNHTKKGKTISFDNEFSASLENFKLNENELDKKRLLLSDDFDISVKDQIFQLSDSVHILQAGEINLSTSKSSVSIKDALLYPAITSGKHAELATTFQVSIPQLQISNFDFLKAYYSKELVLNELELDAPRFQVYSQVGMAKSLDLNKYKFPLPAFISSLSLNELKITNAEVLTYETDGIDYHAKSNFRINLSLPQITLKNQAQNQAQLTSGNLIAEISDFKTPLKKSHELKINQINYNRQQQTIEINQLNVIPFIQKNSGNRFTISAPKLSFSKFDINEALNDNKFIFNEINIDQPEINIEINDSVKGDKLETARNLDLYPYIESYVNQIKINQLKLNDANLNFNWFKKELFNKKINLNFREINIGENQNPAELLHSKEFEISTTDLSTRTKNELYEFTADSLIYNSLKHNILLKNIHINPLLARDDFPRQNGFQTDYLTANLKFIEIEDIDENLWVKNNIVDANTFIIGTSNLEIYRNKRFPFNHNQRPPWPQDLIKNIKQSFVFDSLILQPSYLKYSELMDISDKPGSIEFKKLSLKAGQISNIPEKINQLNELEINASTELFNQAILAVKFNFNLSDKNYSHSVKGSLSKMPLKTINSMLEYAVPISIESGQLNRFDFDIQLDDNNSTGLLYFGYDDFKVSIMEHNSKGLKKSKLASFWANKIMLNSKNPKNDKFEPVPILYERDIERSIINYWWKSIFSGSKKVLGIEDEKSE